MAKKPIATIKVEFFEGEKPKVTINGFTKIRPVDVERAMNMAQLEWDRKRREAIYANRVAAQEKEREQAEQEKLEEKEKVDARQA